MSTAVSISDTQTIRIKNLRLRTVVGINDSEREVRQDVIVNVSLETPTSTGDAIGDTVDYKAITKRIITLVEDSSFNLLETLAQAILTSVFTTPGIYRAVVEVDKPHALRFADSVSVTVEGRR